MQGLRRRRVILAGFPQRLGPRAAGVPEQGGGCQARKLGATDSGMRIVLVLLLLAGVVQANDQWERNRGDCDRTFRAWRTTGVDRIRECVMTWEMYRDVTTVDDDERSVLSEALNKLYAEGEKRDATMALSAMKRLGLRPSQLRVETRAVPRGPAAENVDMVDDRPRRGRAPPEPEGMSFGPGADAPIPGPSAAAERAPDRREAERTYKEGRRYEAKKQYAVAVSEFLIAADADPTWAPPLYLAARCYSKMNRPRAAVEMLVRMRAINSDLARQLVSKAVKDRAFRRLRRLDAFKDLTGTATVQLLNGAGANGVASVLKYKVLLAENGINATIANDRNPRQNSYIYTKSGYEDQGERIRRLLRMGMVHKRKISWPSQYDVVIVHGVKQKTEWIDDEAELAAKNKDADMKKKKNDAEKKKKEEEEAQAAKMREQIQMMKMMQQMNAADTAAGQGAAADPTGGALPPP